MAAEFLLLPGLRFDPEAGSTVMRTAISGQK